MSANRTYGLPYLITRTCNNYGEHQYNEKFLPKIYECVKDGNEVPVYGDGEQIREWIYVYDNVKVICDLMFDEEVINEIYNIGSGVRYKNIELINMISEILNKDVNYKFVPDRLGHDRAYRLNSNKLLGYYKNKNIIVEFKNITNYLKELYQ
jgi:dTDP-glucose 4,6-dehydratase